MSKGKVWSGVTYFGTCASLNELSKRVDKAFIEITSTTLVEAVILMTKGSDQKFQYRMLPIPNKAALLREDMRQAQLHFKELGFNVYVADIINDDSTSSPLSLYEYDEFIRRFFPKLVSVSDTTTKPS